MELRRKIAQNTAVQTLGKVLGTFLSLISAGIVFRLLGDEGFGQYTTIMGFLQIFGTLMDFGLYITLVKRYSDISDSSSPVVNTIFTLRVLSGVVFLGSAPLFALFINLFSPIYSGRLIIGMLLALGFYFFISLNQLLSVIFQKHLQSRRIAIGEFIGKLALLITTATVAWLHWGLYAVLITMVISSGINCAILFFSARKYVHLRFHWDRALIREIFHETWPIALSIVFVQLYFKGDIVFLTFFHTSEAAIGWYGAPYKILEVLVTFPAMFVGLVLPVVTKAWHQKDLPRFQDLVQKSFDALALIAIPMVGGTLVLAPQIMRLLAGVDFTNSTHILQILIFATAAIFMATLFGYLVVAIDRQRFMTMGYGFVALTSLVLYTVIIPRFSIIGAAWVTVYSEITVLIIGIWTVLRYGKIRLGMMTSVKAVVATVAMYVVLTATVTSIGAFINGLLPNTAESVRAGLHLAILVPFGGLVYGVVLIAIRGLRLQELKQLARSK